MDGKLVLLFVTRGGLDVLSQVARTDRLRRSTASRFRANVGALGKLTIEEIAKEAVMQRMRQTSMLAAVVLMSVAVAVTGCGGGSLATPTTPVAQNASVTGQYNLVLTSTNGHGTTNIYTNFTQTGTKFAGAANTLVCPSNDLSQCEGGDASVISITPSGTISGVNVTMMISFPSTAGADTVTMVGTATGINLAGSYTDSLGDAGTWVATASSSLSGNYDGTFNSTPNPLPIAPTILIALKQDASFHLTGTATIMNSLCISSLTLSGEAIGEAFSLTDAASKAHIIALPAGNNFSFSYSFAPTSASCAGDFGRGVVTNKSPFDY